MQFPPFFRVCGRGDILHLCKFYFYTRILQDIHVQTILQLYRHSLNPNNMYSLHNFTQPSVENIKNTSKHNYQYTKFVEMQNILHKTAFFLNFVNRNTQKY